MTQEPEIELTPKQQRFIEEYLIDLNATQAAIRAGYSEDSARQMGSENLSKPYIADAIALRREELSQQLKISQERVLQEYARLAFLDIRKAFDEEGNLKKVQELDDDTAAAIAGLEVEELWEGRGDARENIGRLHKVKLSDKKGSLDSIAKHLGMFVERHELTGKDGGPVKTENMDEATIRRAITDELTKLSIIESSESV